MMREDILIGACLSYFRRNPDTPPPGPRSSRVLPGGVIELCSGDGSLLCRIVDGIEVDHDPNGQAAFAVVESFTISLRCQCGRRSLRSSDAYLPGESFVCPRCQRTVVLPADPLRASRG